MPDNAAMYIGILFKGTEKPIIVMPPENKAEAPAPATDLPIISIGELVAEAHMIDPPFQSMNWYFISTAENIKLTFEYNES